MGANKVCRSIGEGGQGVVLVRAQDIKFAPLVQILKVTSPPPPIPSLTDLRAYLVYMCVPENPPPELHGA